MEYGMIPRLDQFSDNRALEVKKVQLTNESSEIKNKNDLKQIQQEPLQNAKEVPEVKEINTQTSEQSKYEVTLTNTNFGFNDSSKDFFVKAVRGNAENQYPTQNMMRIKSFLMNQDNNTAF
ncbi:MAG: hypothetical protein RBR65_10710 [Aliarcobacter sp.]|jgi:hypothetical protein|nr:hypothetical protein [Aliarcobacter sp.]